MFESKFTYLGCFAILMPFLNEHILDYPLFQLDLSKSSALEIDDSQLQSQHLLLYQKTQPLPNLTSPFPPVLQNHL